MPGILVVFGTRPEAIKLAPLIAELRRDPAFTVRICVTGQHREMLAQVLRLFDLEPDADLDLMEPGQELSGIAAAILSRLPAVIAATRPDVVVVQGDTTSAFAAGLAAFHAGIDVAHVEAGLRSGNLHAPWPEEANRRLLGVVARFHFAPTDVARANLLREGVDPSSVHVTGNSGIDALLQTVARLSDDDALCAQLDAPFPWLDRSRRLILVTGHRRESFGAGLQSICEAVAEIAVEHGGVDVLYPVHLNPHVQQPVHRILGSAARVHLTDPLDYLSFVRLMMRSELLLTDSGGVQEEGATLGKPVLVLRDTTERPEAVWAGNLRVVGTERAAIVAEARRLLRDPGHRASMSHPTRVYGDGHASARIASVLRDALVSRR